jgi:hypothetical protein
MGDNARPHRVRIVIKFGQQEAIDTWPAKSPDMNTTEHVLDVFVRKVKQRNPQCQNIAELINAILKERQ